MLPDKLDWSCDACRLLLSVYVFVYTVCIYVCVRIESAFNLGQKPQLGCAGMHVCLGEHGPVSRKANIHQSADCC